MGGMRRVLMASLSLMLLAGCAPRYPRATLPEFSASAPREVLFDALPIGVAAFDHDGDRIWGNSEGDRLDQELGELGSSIDSATSGVRQIGERTWRIQRVDLPNGGTLVLGEDRSRIAHLEREVDRLEQNLAMLATIGSTSPYVGLFGTVWGIMVAFMEIGNQATATLAVVAPPIAEALIATGP